MAAITPRACLALAVPALCVFVTYLLLRKQQDKKKDEQDSDLSSKKSNETLIVQNKHPSPVKVKEECIVKSDEINMTFAVENNETDSVDIVKESLDLFLNSDQDASTNDDKKLDCDASLSCNDVEVSKSELEQNEDDNLVKEEICEVQSMPVNEAGIVESSNDEVEFVEEVDSNKVNIDESVVLNVDLAGEAIDIKTLDPESITEIDSTRDAVNDIKDTLSDSSIVKEVLECIVPVKIEPEADTNHQEVKSNSDQPCESLVSIQSACSDAQSVGSTDSGKGGSETHASHDSSSNNSQPNSPMNNDHTLVYEFEIPQELCGRLIGKQGKQISQIRSKSHCTIYIRKIPFNEETQICVIEGLQSEIDVALEQIRFLFPIKKYPLVTLRQLNVPLVTGIALPQAIPLQLPDGVTSDVILSSIVNAGHFFVQQPTHPTYPSLSRLDQCMLACYNQMDTPMLPNPIECGMICAAPMMGCWYRAQIMNVNEETEECSIKFVDYGGYSEIGFSSLRQIRSDFMSLPFQASECYLANILPKNESEGFSIEACAIFEELAQGQILQLQIVGYADDGLPCVNMYRIQGISSVFINEELCKRGVANWIEDQSS